MSCAHSFGEWCSECIDGLVRDYNAARQRIKELATVQIRCERVAKGLETALTFPSRLLLDTAVRESIKELRALPLAPEVKDAIPPSSGWPISAETHAFDLVGDERALVFALLDLMQDFEAKHRDPIASAVRAELEPDIAAVIAAGHKLARQAPSDTCDDLCMLPAPQPTARSLSSWTHACYSCGGFGGHEANCPGCFCKSCLAGAPGAPR